MAIDPTKPLQVHETLLATFFRGDTGAVLLQVYLREVPRTGDTITFEGVPWRIDHVHWEPEHDPRFRAIRFNVRVRCVPDLR